MIWKTTINKITGLTFAKSITLAFLAIFLFSANNAQAQAFTPDGNYSASEYAGAVVKDIDLGATGTCQVKQVYSIVKSDSEGPYLLLGFYNGNPGQATFRYYLDTDPNLDLVSETFQGTSYNFPGADVVLQTNASGDGTRIFKYDGSNLVETTDSGIIAAVGDYNLNDGKFIEVKVPLSGDGSIVDICDLAEDFTINLGSYLSFAGKSTTAKVCDFEDISLLIDANGAINGGTAYCSTTNSTILTLSGNYGEVIRWQENDGSGWVNISNTSNTYTANNVAVTTNYRAVIVNNTCPGNEVETGIATITINETPTAEAGNTAELTCSVQTLQLNGSGTGQGNLSYAWIASNGGVIDSGANTATPTVSATGTYTLTVTDDDNGCSATDTVIITQDNTAPTAEAGNTAELTCSVQMLQLNGSGTGQGNLSYAWIASNGGVIDSGANTATPTVSATGTYTLTVTDDDNGCSATDTVIITQDNTAPTAEAGETMELTCTTTSVTLNGSGDSTNPDADLSYAWTGPEGFTSDEAMPSVSVVGTYTLTVTDNDNGCSASTSVTVAQDITPVIADITGNQELTCTTTEITLDSSTSTVQGTASYSWTMNSAEGTQMGTGATLNVDAPGTYFVTVTDSDNGCYASTSVSVAQDITPVVADITGNQELTCTTTEITLDSSTSTVQGTASYSWTMNSAEGTQMGTGATLNVDAPGTYFVTVTDSDNGCSTSTSVTVAQDITPVIADITGNQELTCTTTEITLDGSGSTVQGTASYSWTMNTADGTEVGTGATLDVDAPGTYFVTVTDSDNGCSASTSVTVAQDITPVVADITGNQELTCTTTEITLDASASTVQGTASYSWTLNTADGTEVGTGATLDVDAPGTYFVTVTDSDNGCSASTSVEVTKDGNVPTAAITGNDELTCTTTEITLDASTSTVQGTASYAWTLDSAEGTQVGTGATLNVDAPGTYFVTVTDSDNGCSASTSVTVAQDITPVVADITGNEELTCTTTEITLDASTSTVQGTASYSWTMDSADGTQVGTDATLNVDAPGTYFVTVTDSDNGCSASTSVNVAQDITPVVADITGNEELTCNTTEITLDASTSTVQGTASYSWTMDSADGTQVGTDATLNVDAPGTYFVTVTDSDNGCSASTSVNVAQDITPVVADITSNEELTCNTTEITLDASTSTVQGTASYSWTMDSADGTEVGTSATLNVDAPGTFFVTVTDSDNGCSASTSVTVAQDITPVVADITGNAELTCTTTEITLDASTSTVQGTASYAWTLDSAEGTQVGTGATLNVDAPGTYFVTVTDSDNGCSGSTSVSVAQDITPVVADITGNAELTCTNTEITLDASASTVQGTASYSWTKDGDNTVIGTNETLSVSETGVYYVTVTDSNNGCSDIISVEVTQDGNVPTASITGDEELTCTTTEITLDSSTSTVQGTASYSWTMNSADGTQVGTGATLDVDAPGTYFVTVTDSDNGCSASTSVTVAQDITPVVADITGNQELTCTTTEITLDASASTVQGTASYSWTMNSADGTQVGTGANLNVDTPGTYFVTVTDSDNGCSASTSVTVAQDITPVVADITGNEELTCTTTEITLDASTSTVQGTASYSWTKDGDNTVIGTNEILSVSETGVYYVTVTDSDNGCSDITSVEVTKDGNVPTASITGDEELTCTTTEITLDASASTVQGTASYSWTMNSAEGTQVGTGATLNVDAPGTYFVTVTDSDNGCSASTSVNVAQDITPVVADITGNQELTCTTTEITLDASTSTVQGTASYSWTMNSADGTQVGTGATLNVDAPGTYFVTVTDSDNGCSGSTSVSVAQDITPVVADITGNQELTCNTTEITLDASPSSVQGTASYSWTMNTADGTQVGTGATLNVDAPGTYYVTVTDSDNGCSASTSVSVAQDITPVVADITGNQELTCNTTEITLDASASSVQGTASYSWTLDSAEGTQVGTGATLNVDAPGTYYVTVTDSDNGCSASTSVSVAQDVLSVEAIITGNEDLDCNNTSVILDAGSSIVQSTATYLWSTGETSESIEVTEAGEYTVTVTDSDNGCSDEISVILNFIEDTEPPVITDCAVEVKVSADAGICEASEVDLGMPIATDNCPAELTIENDAPEVFPLGQTIVTWTITDASNNSTQCEQIVNVRDDQAPVIAECAAPLTVPADMGICSASQIELGMPVATDNCDNDLEITNDAPEVFELGDTTVTWTVTDNAGNTATCTQTVTVVDDQAPVVETMTNIEVNSDAGVCGAVVNFEMIGATDNCEIASVEVTEGLVSGSEFPIGTTSVTWTVTDGSGNSITSTFTVTVEDNEAPEISCPGNMTVSTETGVSYATVDFDNATATDNCEVSVEQTGGPVSGSQFEIGTTTVTFTATDAAGNTSECSFTVTVEDNEDPSIICPSNIEQSNDEGICGATIEFAEPDFADNSGEVTIEQTAGPASGEIFPVGTTTVTYLVTDAAGNTAECSFTVTITDDEGPSIEQKDNITVGNDQGSCGAVVNFATPEATDNCGIESVTLTEGLDSGSEFPNGTTSVVFTATDTQGNTATSTFTVTVNDTEAPSIECPENISVTVENGTESVVVEYTSVSTTDNCEGTTVVLTEGMASGEAFPVGETTITYTVTDAAGNSTSCSFTVTVDEEELPTAPSAPSATLTQATCAEPTGTITVETVEGLTYSIDGENYQTEGVFADLAPGTYDVVAQDEFGQLSELTTVVIEDPVAQEIETVSIDPICDDQGDFDLFDLLTGDYDETGNWIDTNNSGALNGNILDPSVPAPGSYTFEYIIEGNCPSITTVSLTIDDCVVLDCSIEDIKDGISKAVTPNGDNKNDVFKVDLDLACGFTYNVKIFNRWGAKVFDAPNYQNNWDGYSDSSFTSSNQLPSGTYFYILEIREGNFEPIQGYIYLGTK